MNLQYAAGIFDGEGYVYIFKKQRNLDRVPCYYVSAGVNMTHLPTIQQFHETFGGHINNGSKRTNPNHRPLFMWGVANRKAVPFLEAIRPYVSVKAEQIDVAIELQANIKHYGYIPRKLRFEILDYREKLYQRCKALKEVSFAPLLKKGPGPNGGQRGRPPGH